MLLWQQKKPVSRLEDHFWLLDSLYRSLAIHLTYYKSTCWINQILILNCDLCGYLSVSWIFLTAITSHSPPAHMYMCSWSQQSPTLWFHSGANWCLLPIPIVNNLGDLPKVTYKLAYPYLAYFQTTSLPLLPLPHLFMTPQGVFIENTGQYHQCNPTQREASLEPTQITPELQHSCFHTDSIRALAHSQGGTHQYCCILAELWLRTYFNCLPLNTGSLEKSWPGNYFRGLNCSMTLYEEKLMAFPSKLSPSCPGQMTAFPCMCPKLGEGRLSFSVNGGNVFNGQDPLHSAVCLVPNSFSFSFKTLVYSKRNVVHVFLLHLHLNHLNVVLWELFDVQGPVSLLNGTFKGLFLLCLKHKATFRWNSDWGQT